MSAEAVVEHFRADARLLAQMLDPLQDRVLLAAMSEADYRAASFLDQRILADGRLHQWVPWTWLVEAAKTLPERCDFIFHIGHVGSTLLSRLLGELPQVLSVREPAILRSLAEAHALGGEPESLWPPDESLHRLPIVLRCLSRSFASGQVPIVKATSFVSELAGAIAVPERRSLFLYARPEIYLPTILSSDASLLELIALGGARLARLHRRIGEAPWRFWQMTPGERAAMAWASEMTALGEAAGHGESGHILWADFDSFLAAPDASLETIAAHFGLDPGRAALAALASGPLMGRYSKAPEHAYSPGQRAEIAASGRSIHAVEVDRGLRWLEAAARFPKIEAALVRARKGH